MANKRPRFPHLARVTELSPDDLFVVRRAENGQDREVAFGSLNDVFGTPTDELEKLDKHVENTENPHGVTARQVGAATLQQIVCPTGWFFTVTGHPMRFSNFCVVLMS